jgi:alpha-L-fucosidase
MHRKHCGLGLLIYLGGMLLGLTDSYQPNWASLDQRHTPGWFEEAKFGIFIHWGVYSVPAWGPKGSYAEWYWHELQDTNKPTYKFHVQTYGKAFQYQDFAGQFKAELFNPGEWADLFARSGAKYVVLTSKHHEGFCLWPNAQSWNWNSVDIGPHRDLCGDLTKAVRSRGLKMGFYYSLYEWYNPVYKADFKRFVDEHFFPQFKDLVTRYEPSLIFADGEWEHPSESWRSPELLAWLFNESPCRAEVVINDRWGKETRGKHGGYYTTEYGEVHVGQGKDVPKERHPWEENRGIGRSFGYNRNESVDDYRPAKGLIHLLVDMSAQGGNLLLDVGPTADGRIPVIMQQRLAEMGEWLRVNGEAIYGTHAWRQTAEGKSVRYTAKGKDLYAICLEWPEGELTLQAPKPGRNTEITLLGGPGQLQWTFLDERLKVAIPPLSVDQLPCQHAYVFKLTAVE